MSAEEHPSASAFNKFDTKCLMGNWREELALKASTGVSRVQVRSTVRLISVQWLVGGVRCDGRNVNDMGCVSAGHCMCPAASLGQNGLEWDGLPA